MKTIQSTFSVNDENEKTLYKKTFFNKRGYKYKEIDYDRTSVEETNYAYNSNGLLIKETVVIDGIEVSSQYFDYDENDNIVLEEHFVNGEMYEKVIVTFNENHMTRLTYQDDIETERLERVDNDKNWNVQFFVNNELVEQKDYIFDSDKNVGILILHSLDYNYITKTYDTFNTEHQLVKQEQFSDKGNLIYSFEASYDNFVIFERMRNFHNYESCTEKVFKYDNQGNELSFELKKCNGVLLEFCHKKYDELNRIIEEKGSESLSHDSGYSDIRGIHYFHFIHTYEDLD